jgi:hypothetical protein
MRNTWILLIFIAGLFGFNSCSGESTDATQVDEELYEFQGFSMKPYDIPVMIMLPDETANIGASTQPEVLHEEGGFRWEINVGPNYTMVIDDWGSDREMVTSEKKRLKSLEFYKINYIVDEPDLIVYERELKVSGNNKASKSVGVQHKTFHVYGQKVFNDITYVFQSRDEGYEKVIIDLMTKSIKSIKSLDEKPA